MSARSDLRSPWAVIPVKPFARAKQRLATVLDADERAQFARLMFEDVLAVLAGSTRFAGILVVTRDEAAAALARAQGADVLHDRGLDLNAAVRSASAFVRRQGDIGMLVIPADVPLISLAAVEGLIEHMSAPCAVALVPATRDGGTNVLACRPADAISPSFGPDSFRRHWQAACTAGLTPVVVSADDAGLDIDLPEDLASFLSRATTARSHAFLAARDVARRLSALPPRERRRTVEA